jgi:hypothetical protein
MKIQGSQQPSKLYKKVTKGRSRTIDTVVAFVIVVAVIASITYFLLDNPQNSGVISQSQIPPGTPVYHIVEGQPGYPYAYYPDNLTIPADRIVVIALTDNLGGCALETIFQGLGVHGGNAVVNVPVGATKYVEIFAPTPGTYIFHCGAYMSYGYITAE